MMIFRPVTRHKMLKRGVFGLALASTAALLVACSGGGAATTDDTSDAVPGEFPTSGTVYFFGASTENPYFQLNADGAVDAADELGWDVEHVISNTQEEQDAAIQQMLQGEKPLGVLLYPIAGEAAIASEQAITSAGLPLIIMGQAPAEEQAEIYTAYAGVNDVLSGETAAQLLIDGAAEAGITLGDGVIVNTLAGHTATADRAAGFARVMAEKSPSSKILADEPSGGFLEAEGYAVGSQIIPANKGKINWVYGVNDALAVGAMQAAKETGIVPGKDMLFVGGTCMNAGTNQAVIDGELVGTAVQSPWVEGSAAMKTLAAYMKTGEVLDGAVDLDAAAAPSIDKAPSKYNFMPNPPVANNQESFDTTMVWGMPASELCDYS